MPTLLRSRTLWIFLLIVGLIRLITLSIYPLMDTTEARYVIPLAGMIVGCPF